MMRGRDETLPLWTWATRSVNIALPSGGSVPNPLRYILCVLGIAIGGLPSCGGTTRTCLAINVSYNGSKSGTAYIKVLSDDGGRTFSHAGPEPSIQALMLVENSGVTCFGGGEPIDIPFTGTAWIDVSGAGAANCSPNVLSTQCQPFQSDPQAHQSAVLRFGQLTRIPLDVVDPP
jgi:hypothetical protein